MDPEFARQYYESAGAEHWWFQGRRRLVARLLRGRGVDDGRFVDLGAGAESLLPSSLATVKLDIVRPDPAPHAFVQGSAEALPFTSETFDGVGLFDVLEHLTDPRDCLAEVRRVLRVGGVVLVTVPAHQRLWSPHDDLVGHRRRYELGQLEECLSASGLDVVWASAFYGFLVAPALVRTLLSLHSPMVLPRPSVNRILTNAAVRSVDRVLRRPSRLGLSIGALAVVS